jgi:hypothetical protein
MTHRATEYSIQDSNSASLAVRNDDVDLETLIVAYHMFSNPKRGRKYSSRGIKVYGVIYQSRSIRPLIVTVTLIRNRDILLSQRVYLASICAPL